jgi:hypothetical protein
MKNIMAPVGSSDKIHQDPGPPGERPGSHGGEPVAERSRHVEGELEDQPHGGQEEGDPQEPVQGDPVDLLGHLDLPDVGPGKNLPGQPGGPGVPCVRHEGLDILAVGG